MCIVDVMITQQELKERLDYNPDTGEFTWKVSSGTRAKIGSVAGTKDRNGYIRISINEKRYLAHRLAWFYMNSEWPQEFIDHINHIKDDNRYLNLRLATKNDNSRNAKMRVDNKCGYKGVSIDGTKYKAQICKNHKRITLGRFDTAEEAHAAYIAAAKIHFKDFACSG